MKVLVFDIGGTSIKYGKCENGVLTEVQETPTYSKRGGRHIINTIISLIKKQSDFDAIGVSTAGQVNAEEGFIIYANSNIPEYTGMQIGKELNELFGVPVAVENDVNCAALGEAKFGAGKEFQDFLCLTYGTGIGGAIVIDGEIYHGSRYSAGEFGAMITHSIEKNREGDYFKGCYECYASVTALINQVEKYRPELNDGKKIFSQMDDPEILKILDDWVEEIMLGLTSLVHIFNPACVVLGGGIMEQPWIIEKIREKKSRFFMPNYAHVELKPALLKNQAGLFGAYYLALKKCGI